MLNSGYNTGNPITTKKEEVSVDDFFQQDATGL